MAARDVLSKNQLKQLMGTMTSVGEHDYRDPTADSGQPMHDPEGNHLWHEHNASKARSVKDLPDYAKPMVYEGGPRQLNSMQDMEGIE